MMKRLLLCLLALMSSSAFAQYIAGGVYGGSQPCSYAQGPAPGASDEDDYTRELEKQKSALQKKLTAAKRRQSKDKREATGYKREITNGLKGDVSNTVLKWMETAASLSGESGHCDGASGGQTVSPGGGSQPLQPPARGQVNPEASAIQNSPVPIAGFCQPVNCAPPNTGTCGNIDWASAKAGILQDGGGVSTDICNNPFLGKHSAAGSDSSASSDCQDGISNYQSAYQQWMADNDEVKDLKQELKQLDRDIDDAKSDADEDGTEHCAACDAARRGGGGGGSAPSFWQSLLGAAVVGGLGYLNYRNTSNAISTDARLGWPTDPYSTIVGGYPYLQAGLGILGGGAGGQGSGGYACGQTVGGGGPYGFLGANSPYGQYGGGAFGYPSAYAPYPGYGGALNGYPGAGGYGLGAWPGYGMTAGGPVPVPGYGLQIGLQVGMVQGYGSPTSLLPYPGGGGYPGAYPGAYPGYGLTAGINPQALYASQIAATGYSEISQLQSQILAIQTQIQSVGGAPYSVLPYPSTGSTAGYGYTTGYTAGYASGSSAGPVPVPGTGTTTSPYTTSPYSSATGVIYGR